MLVTFERFAEQEFWSEKDLDPFVRSHPVAAHRLNQLREKVAASPYANDKDPPQLQLRHDMMRAKLDGHVLAPQIVYNRYPASDTACLHATRAPARNCSGGCVQPSGIDASFATSRTRLFLGAEGRAVREDCQPTHAIGPCAGRRPPVKAQARQSVVLALADHIHAGPALVASMRRASS